MSSALAAILAIDDFTSQSGTSQASRSLGLPPATKGELCFSSETSNRWLSRITAESHTATSHSNHSRLIAPSQPQEPLRNRRFTCFRLGPQKHSTAAEPQPHHSRIAPETKPNHSHIAAASQPNHSHMTGTREPNPLLSNSENSQNHVFQVLIHRRSVCFRITAESQPNHCHIRTRSQPLRKSPIRFFQARTTAESQPQQSRIRAFESSPIRLFHALRKT